MKYCIPLLILLLVSPALSEDPTAVYNSPDGGASKPVTVPQPSANDAWPGRPLPDNQIPRLRQLDGLGTMVDLDFPYYQDRSPRGLAKEIRAHGFSWVAVFAHQLTPEYAKAFHDEGLAVVAHLWGTIIYGPDKLDPPPPADARQVFIGGPQRPDASPAFFCPNHDDFIDWYRKFIVRYVDGRDIDLLIIGEAFLGSWQGPKGKSYGCFCDQCLKRFKAQYPGVEGFPDFKDPNNPRYWKTNKTLYRKWVAFRAATLARFTHEAYGALIRRFPHIPIAGYMLAVDDPDGIAKVRERNGQDIDLLPAALPFDFFLFQAHWPDWTRPALDPVHHVDSYRPFLDRVRARFPHLRIGMTTDSGSNVKMRRSMAWINTAHVAALNDGFDLFGIYEYSISKFIYDERPRIIQTSARRDSNTIEVVFSKRMDAASTKMPQHYTLDKDMHPVSVRFDGGNIVTLAFTRLPKGPTATLKLNGILDDAATFWFNSRAIKEGKKPEYPANAVDPSDLTAVALPEK